MNDHSDAGTGAGAKRFYRVNGPWLFLGELGRRGGVIWRRRMFGGKLRCPTITLGPHCHLRGLAYISIGRNFQAAEGLWLEALTRYAGEDFTPNITIGNNVLISRWSHIAAVQRVEIGDGVLIGSKVTITDHNHGQYDRPNMPPIIPPALRQLSHGCETIIERNVWLGDGVVVCPGAKIGEGAIVGANAVVTGTIPPFTIAAGVPARPLKRYSFETNEWVRIG